MKCEKYLNMIDDLVEGDLDEQTTGQVNLHILDCQKCQFHYEALKQEKEMFAHYLFDVQAPNELWVKFQTKLDAEPNNTFHIAKTSAGVFSWKGNIFEYLRLTPALACAVLLIVFGIGFGLLNFLSGEKVLENDFVANTEFRNVQPAITKPTEIIGDKTLNPKANTESSKVAVLKINNKNKIARKKTVLESHPKFLAINEAKINKQSISQSEKEVSAVVAQLAEEEQMQRLQIRNLENEAAKQIEKVEMLLRSFRNARVVEGSETFDVVYEKEQARRLLEKNVRLRQNAENYGSLHTEDILSRVEPYLLDIANLESTPSAEKVRDIKARVSNQNIIASLQTY